MNRLIKIPAKQYADLLITKHKYDVMKKGLTERGLTLAEEISLAYNNVLIERVIFTNRKDGSINA